MRLFFTPLAEQDLESTADYIAADDPRRAITFVQELRQHSQRTALSPPGYRMASQEALFVRNARTDAGIQLLAGVQDPVWSARARRDFRRTRICVSEAAGADTARDSHCAPPGSLVLDSFAGTGTTTHAVLKQNAEDGGNRRFILVEMDGKIARNVTAERIKRVVVGHVNGNGAVVDALGGGFQFCRLSATEKPIR